MCRQFTAAFPESFPRYSNPLYLHPPLIPLCYPRSRPDPVRGQPGQPTGGGAVAVRGGRQQQVVSDSREAFVGRPYRSLMFLLIIMGWFSMLVCRHKQTSLAYVQSSSCVNCHSAAASHTTFYSLLYEYCAVRLENTAIILFLNKRDLFADKVRFRAPSCLLDARLSCVLSRPQGGRLLVCIFTFHYTL